MFNSTNIHIRVNGYWLEDAASISYQQQGGSEPVYGYMDQEFRTATRRTNLIVGTIGIYFKEHDKFFRTLGTRTETATRQTIESERSRIRSEVAAATNAGDILSLLSRLNIDSEEFDKYVEELERINNIHRTTTVDRSPIPNSDVLGASGWDRLRGPNSIGGRQNGARIDIHYGEESLVGYEGDNWMARATTRMDRRDTRYEVETLYNVYLIGRAKSPIENTPGNSAEAVMEYYSFYASHVGRPL